MSPSPSTSAANTLRRRIGGGGDGVRREVLAAVVLVPGDLVVVERRGEDVDVAVAVHVGRKHALAPVGGGADRVLAAEDAAGQPRRQRSSPRSLPLRRRPPAPPTPRLPAVLSRNRAYVVPSAAQLGTSNVSVLLPTTTRDVVGDLLARPAPGAVAVEVDPGIELGRAAPCTLTVAVAPSCPTCIVPNVTPSSSGAVAESALAECAPSVSMSRVAPSVGPTASCARAVLGQRRGIRSGRVAEVRSVQVLVPGDLVVIDGRGEDVQCRRRRPRPPQTRCRPHRRRC